MFESWVALESFSRENHSRILARAAEDRLAGGRPRTPREPRARNRWRLGTWLGRGLVSLGTRMQEADRRRYASGDGGLKQAS